MFSKIKSLRVLIIEDNIGDFILISEYFKDELPDPVLVHVRTFGEAKEILSENQNFDAILLDLSLPDLSGEALVTETIALADPIPVIVLTGFADKEFGIKTLSLGISDYLFKDELSPSILSKSLVYGMERKRIGAQLKKAEMQRVKHDKEITKAVIIAQERERKEIGSELHDNVNQLLAASKLNLSLAKDEKIHDKALEWIHNAENYIEQALNDIRKLSHRLIPNSFQESTLIEAFNKLLQGININNTFKINFTHSHFNEGLLNEDLKLNLYRILQEQVKNILEYSKANFIELNLTTEKSKLIMRIYDNGCGFDPKNVKNGIGLSNIKQRAELFMGKLMLNSYIGKGCEMIIEIPISEKSNTISDG